MPPPEPPKQKYLSTTVHDFKSNIAKYIRFLENSEEYDGISIKRYRRKVALVLTYKNKKNNREGHT